MGGLVTTDLEGVRFPGVGALLLFVLWVCLVMLVAVLVFGWEFDVGLGRVHDAINQFSILPG